MCPEIHSKFHSIGKNFKIALTALSCVSIPMGFLREYVTTL